MRSRLISRPKLIREPSSLPTLKCGFDTSTWQWHADGSPMNVPPSFAFEDRYRRITRAPVADRTIFPAGDGPAHSRRTAIAAPLWRPLLTSSTTVSPELAARTGRPGTWRRTDDLLVPVRPAVDSEFCGRSRATRSTPGTLPSAHIRT